MFSFIYPITRYGELETTITSDKILTKEKEVMAFYETRISPTDIIRITTAYNAGEISDTFDYIKDNLINRPLHKSPCTYREIMGDCQFYEGLNKIAPSQWTVSLGS